MINTENLEGMCFGRLTVIARDDDYVSNQGYYQAKWECLCECGMTKHVLAGHLKSGKIKSCGCLRKDVVKELHTDDLAGLRFGNLTALRVAESRVNPDGSHRTRWLCECSCGREATVWSKHLKAGYTISCGCAKESFMASELKKYFAENYSAISEYKAFRNPKTNAWLSFDIFIPDLSIFIEVNGEQHYEINYRHTQQSERNGTSPLEEFKNQKSRDAMKKRYANKIGTYIEIDISKLKTVSNAISYIENLLPQ